jgi:hypothetical protein
VSPLDRHDVSVDLRPFAYRPGDDGPSRVARDKIDESEIPDFPDLFDLEIGQFVEVFCHDFLTGLQFEVADVQRRVPGL